METSLRTMTKNFKILKENVSKLENRIKTIEEQLSKDKERDVQQYKLLENMVISTKETLNKIEVEFVEDKREHESSKVVIKLERKCKFWNAGFCKFKEACPFQHPVEICNEDKCEYKTCIKRHPQICKQWTKGSCKFQDLCEFRHEDDSEQNLNDAFVDYDNIDSDDDSDQFDKNNEKHKPESCDKCDFVTTNKIHLKMHEKSCHKKVETIIESDVKNEESSKHISDNFVDYDNLDSDDDHIFSCDICNYTSNAKSSLTKHVKNVHKKDDPKLLKRKRESDDLPSRKKTKEVKFSCDECEFKTNNKKILKKHKETSCETKLVQPPID